MDPTLNFTVPANATKIYNYLSSASKSLNTYVKQPAVARRGRAPTR